MSRIGKIPVSVPQGVSVSINEQTVTVKGPKGTMIQTCSASVSFELKDSSIIIGRNDENKQTKAFHGLYRNLINNMIIGVFKGFSKTLLITGVGYKAEVKDNILILSLGYSSDVYMIIPQGILVAVEAGNKVKVSGINKQQIGEFAANIRKFRPIEPYKGKGIRYENEFVRRKVGKKAGVK
ncbi:MAG: 50S ribosomal protein L6 [Treponema sp.]|jgi:large subunit ribosomal protein L6|nr:50S ribosomal protein L6 [Treponema sp.]